MKILELRFKNLNSLYGEWMIDFTAPEYISNGIFALTGPTGAGKSTILDAICLALWGATPRLGKITKSGNGIMSRQTGECYAEVLFESQAGRFRCHWEQRRARKNADGNLQDQEHQLADADTGKLIETKKSLVSGIIEEKTGMDFDRFTRSILLAQGGFDTFLKADIEQKSRILEQITGTEIYSQISQRVHERYREEREKLNLLQAETSGIVILAPDQERQIQIDLAEKQKQETALASRTTETGKAIAWLASIDGLKKEISSLAKEAVRLQIDTEAFKPEHARLDRAMKAATLDGSYATLSAIRTQQSDDINALKAEEKTLPELEIAVGKQAESLKFSEQQTVKAKEALKNEASVLKKVRFFDQKLAEQKKTVLEVEARCMKEAAKIHAEQQARVKEQEKQNEAEKNLELADGWLKAHARDEWLLSGLAGVEEQLGNLFYRQQEIIQKEADLRNADKALAQATKQLDKSRGQCTIQTRELEDTSKKLCQGKDALSELLKDRLLREYRTEKETLLREMAYIRKIEAHEDHRAKLIDSQPCPLCGSREHPFAKGNVPVPDETEKKIEALAHLISKAENQETAIKKLEEAEGSARKKLADIEKLEAAAANDKKAAEKTLAELTDGLKKLRAGFAELKQGVSGKLKPLGISEIPETQISTFLASLKTRLNAWQDQVRKKAEIEKKIAAFDSEMNRLGAVIETQSTTLAEKQKRLEMLKKEHAVGSDARRQLYGDKNPDHEESRLNQVVADAEKAEKKAGSLHVELLQKLNTIRNHVESLRLRIKKRTPELEQAEADFSSARETAGFSDEKQFLDARLTHEQLNDLSARAKNLDDKQTDLKARQKDRENRLNIEISRKITDKTPDELEALFRVLEESFKELRDAIAGLRHSLNENAAAKERIKEKQTAVEAQKKECRRWEKLHSLIGSADGKKYRNFAQGLTFELMVSHANRQLEKMTDRYLLIRDDRQPLELNVIDNYQAGEIRSTRNLSGGESFIVSLALALGLSRMASRKVRVDSLFLDEGFGTLDEETLETALESLSGLQQDGKLIGIISHVAALKERICTQLTIIPVSGGRSNISGPGCGKVARKEE